MDIEELREWLADPALATCGPGKALARRSKSIKEHYDNMPNSIFFFFRMCVTRPDLTLELMLRCVEEKLPSYDMPPDLEKAREVLLDRDATDEEMTEQMEIVNARSRCPAMWKEYYRIVYYMLSWRLGLHDARIALNLQRKMWMQLQRSGAPDGKASLMRYLREIFPAEKWEQT